MFCICVTFSTTRLTQRWSTGQSSALAALVGAYAPTFPNVVRDQGNTLLSVTRKNTPDVVRQVGTPCVARLTPTKTTRVTRCFPNEPKDLSSKLGVSRDVNPWFFMALETRTFCTGTECVPNRWYLLDDNCWYCWHRVWTIQTQNQRLFTVTLRAYTCKKSQG